MREAIGVSPARARARAWTRAAAAAGVVLLVAGCGGGNSGEGTGTPAPPPGTTAPAGAGAGAQAGGGLDAVAVSREIAAAATAAGFTEEPSDDVPPALKSCMVSWQVDDEKAADSRKSYDDTVAALAEGGWKRSPTIDRKGAVITSLDKSGWTVKAGHHSQDGFLVVSFIATDNGPGCQKLFQEDLEKNKNAR
ncbi:hypothetical protein [Streptomyces lavendulocolor]|uniref:hypothetical protein n=1 Tax=Streptomyces lavendulocolor TaxID=67316 RepID=UPI003C2C7AD9